MKCPKCQSEQVARNGKTRLKVGSQIQKYLCGGCGKQFNERTGTVMARLRTPVELVTIAMNVRTEGMGLRAAGRSLGKSHSTIIEWERKLANKLSEWSPAAPIEAEITIEGDEVYTRVGENLSPL
jgi:transposase-like protein